MTAKQLSCIQRLVYSCLFLFFGIGIGWAETPVRVMSFNIRYGTASDGPNRWELRKEFLVDTIRNFAPDLLGTQETLEFQRAYLADQFKDFESFGVGRDDGLQQGEMAALFYRRDRFKKLDGGHFWLSPTPAIVGSKGWDAALPRIATWVKLQDLFDADSKPLFFLNTHFDHKGTVARVESAKLVRSQARELGTGCRIVITGDFNAAESSDPYRALFESDPAASARIPLVDTYKSHGRAHTSASQGTFSGFKAENTSGARIDWIACSEDWQVRNAGIDRTSKEGRTPSDHFPVTAILRSRDPKPTLRVLTYNIHHARGLDDQLDIRRIARVIRQADPDFVALQEVDVKTTRSGGVDQAAELAEQSGMFHIFGKAIDYAGGDYGQAILSRFPLEELGIAKLANLPGREQRIVVSVAAMVPGWDRVGFATTHLDHAHEELRLEQAKQLEKAYDTSARISILAGDLNATPESQVLSQLMRTWSTSSSSKPMLTIPANRPEKQLDYILYRSSQRISVVAYDVLVEPLASDHLPVVLVLQLED
ncbi:MAG: endonuclease/exonuclease/phosphatase family protein [Planctomycetes bacterium]|nr:endonuclease/exonuclease/phosphatase family protein [Planctomycetota bacterium]